MLIHAPEFANLRAQIAEQLPDYAIAFDVVFESRGLEATRSSGTAITNRWDPLSSQIGGRLFATLTL